MVEAPPTCRVVGYSGDVITALEHSEYPVFGVQFHPEVQLTKNGTQMFKNFLYKVCGILIVSVAMVIMSRVIQIAGCKGHYSMENRRQMCIDYIRRSVGESSVLVFIT